MDNITYSFEKLNAWQEAKKLVVAVYQLLDSFPKFENYALCDQIRRSIVSVPSNIAEGSGRTSVKEKIHFLEIAFGSMMEVFCELQTATDLNYITEQQFDRLRPRFTDIAKMLSGLRNSFLSKTSL